jgi:nitrate/nitrite transport system ATP-binding protein
MKETDMMDFVSVQDLQMEYPTKKGSFLALKDINLTIGQGECVALIGHSGCGKSTLLNLIAGLLSPTRGGVSCDQKRVEGPGPDRAVVFQNHNLLPWMTCFQNIYLGVERVFGHAESKQQLQERTRAALRLVGLEKAAERYPQEISGGMKQRIGLARALAIEPKVLLLDEPFGALDALTRSALQDELNRIIQNTHSTVVMVTHDVDEAVFLADRIVMLARGPGATVHKVLPVDLPRPRDRLDLVHNAHYADVRGEVMEFLFADAG